MGYILYWIKNDVFHIKDMIYLTQNARRGLWNFITAHFSMVERVEGNTYKNEPIAFQLEDSEIKETIRPYYMARIIDVEQFLLEYPFEKNDMAFHFRVTDEQAAWNNNVFSVSWDENGQIQITNDVIGPEIALSINTLSAMLMSYRRPTYFQKIERINVNSKTLALLEEVIPRSQPYFSDYF